MKKARLIHILITISILAAFASGCMSSSPIEKAVMATEVSTSGEPKVISDKFPPDVNTMYCSVKVSYPSAKSNLKAEWYVVKSDEAGLTDTLIGEETVSAGAQYVVVSFTRADKLLPRGDYAVKLYYDGKYLQAVPFKIEGTAAASAATLSEATLCTSIDSSTDKPIDKVDVFPDDISNIYCSVKINGADFNTSIRATWIYVDGDLKNLKGKTIYDLVVKAEGNEYISFSIGVPSGKQFPLGEYKIILFVEDKEQVTLPFKVVDPASIKWPYIGAMAVFTASVSDNNTVLLSAPFSSDVKQINLQVKPYNAPPDTVIVIQWWLSRSADSLLFDEQMNEDKIPIQGNDPIFVALTAKTDPFIKGTYAVKLLVNGKEYAVIPFSIK